MIEKKIIGMVHLKPMPTSPNNENSINEILKHALADLKVLEEAGIKYAIVENVFDTPYSSEIPLELLIGYTKIFTVLQNSTTIELGVNIHATDGVEEMLIASICDASFIRSETFVEYRNTMSGMLKPMSARLLRKRKEMNSEVKIFADVNVKESRSVYGETIEEAIHDALGAQADAIIVTGFETGKAPQPKEIQKVKELLPDTPLLIGSGVSADNISEFMKYADGAIVGSSIKEKGDISKRVSLKRTKDLLNKLCND